MPKGPPPQWNRRDCRFDYLVEAAIGQGYGRELRLKGITTWERADDIRRGIYRCAAHRGVSAAAGPSRIQTTDGEMGVWKSGGGYELRFKVFTKTDARKNHLARHGTDRARWPYDPRRPATDEERESWANRTEHGEIVKHG